MLLGELTSSCRRGRPAKNHVDVRFTYDTSGLLEVQATTLSTGRVEKLVIEGNPGVMQPDEIARRLGSTRQAQDSIRATTPKMRALIARAERFFEERLGDTSAVIGHALAIFTAALDRQIPDAIREARRSRFRPARPVRPRFPSCRRQARMWDELGIAPCDDPKAIRRAYAARLKKLDPDRDPNGFARLRDAYEWALKRAGAEERRIVAGAAGIDGS